MSSDAAPARRIRGTVKQFNDAHGFGLVAGADGVEAFVHYSAIVGEGFLTLVRGEEVEYELEQRLKGPAAVRVKRTGRTGGQPADDPPAR
jgi:CspA family cold shock protein